jgi:hypothetical protein
MHNLRSRGTVRHTSYPYRLVKRLLGQHGGHDAGQTAGGGGSAKFWLCPIALALTGVAPALIFLAALDHSAPWERDCSTAAQDFVSASSV